MADELTTNKAFDYSEIDKDPKAKLIYCAGEINKQKEIVGKTIVVIGEMLSTAQEQLAQHGKGTFQNWVQSECGFSIRTAYNYLSAFRVFGDCATVAQMEDSALYALASNGTPEKAIKEALKLTGQGVKITQSKAKEIIKKHQPPKEPKPPKEPEVEFEDQEEEEIEDEPTIEEICEEDNRAIEAFCRGIVKQFQRDVPRIPWTEDSGRIESALSGLRAGLQTLRGAKSVVCEACVEGQTGDGDCRYCKGHGYLPVYKAKAIPEDAKL